MTVAYPLSQIIKPSKRRLRKINTLCCMADTVFSNIGMRYLNIIDLYIVETRE